MSQREHAQAGTTRRGFIAGSVAVVGAGATGAIAVATASGDDGPWHVGEFGDRTGGSAFTLKLSGSGSVVAVTLADDATVLHDSGDGLDAFTRGQEVTVQARHAEDGSLIASRLEVMFRVVDTTILERDGKILRTSDGDLSLPPSARPEAAEGWAGEHLDATPLNEIGAGDRVFARVTRSARSKALRVFRIGERIG